MASRLTVHIGPFKTGTTTVQQGLVRLSKESKISSFVYPSRREDFSFGKPVMAAILSQPPWSQHSLLVSKYYGDLMKGDRSRFNRNFDGLARDVRASNGHVIISSEVAALLNREGASRFLGALGECPKRVVVTARPVSELIPSYYQQIARGQFLPPLETFTRQIIEELLTEDHSHESPRWMSVRWLRSVWLPEQTSNDQNINFHVVPISRSEPARALRFLIGETEFSTIQIESATRVSNPSWHFVDTLTWQHWLRWQKDMPISVLNRLNEDFSAYMSNEMSKFRNLAPQQPKLTRDLGILLDTVFPIDGSFAPPGSILALRYYLDSGKPLVISSGEAEVQLAIDLHKGVATTLNPRRRLLMAQASVVLPALGLYRRVISRKSNFLTPL